MNPMFEGPEIEREVPATASGSIPMHISAHEALQAVLDQSRTLERHIASQVVTLKLAMTIDGNQYVRASSKVVLEFVSRVEI